MVERSPRKPDGDAPPKAKAHHLGHRERLRERVLGGGLGTSPDYEVLELYLFRSIRMADVKPLAKSLLTRFGSATSGSDRGLSTTRRSIPGRSCAAPSNCPPPR